MQSAFAKGEGHPVNKNVDEHGNRSRGSGGAKRMAEEEADGLTSRQRGYFDLSTLSLLDPFG